MKKMTLLYANIFICSLSMFLNQSLHAQTRSEILRAIGDSVLSRGDIIVNLPTKQICKLPVTNDKNDRVIELSKLAVVSCDTLTYLKGQQGKYSSVNVVNDQLIADYIAPAVSSEVKFVPIKDSKIELEDTIVMYPSHWKMLVNDKPINSIWFTCKTSINSIGLPNEDDQRSIKPFFVEAGNSCYKVNYEKSTSLNLKANYKPLLAEENNKHLMQNSLPNIDSILNTNISEFKKKVAMQH